MFYPNYGPGAGSYNPRPHRVEIDLKQNGSNAMSGVEDKVEVQNIFKSGGGEGGGMGGLATAAVVAAMGNRNEGNSLAGIAPLLLAGRGDGFSGGFGGFGAGLVGGVLGGLLFGGRRGGLFGGGEDCGGGGVTSTIGTEIILNKLGSIEGAIPLAALQTENAILTQTNALNSTLGSLALGTQLGFSNVKDSVQANSALNLAASSGVKDAVQTGTAIILQAICSSTKEITNQAQAFQTANDSRLINAQAAEIIELRNDRDNRGRHASLELQITNTNTAVAAQAQAQQQFQVQRQGDELSHLTRCMSSLLGEFQIARATNSNVIVGNTGATTTGAMAANPTNVRA